MGLHLNYEPKRMAERVGFTSQRFAKLYAVKDMPQNAVFTAIFVVSHLSHTEIFRWPPFHGLRVWMVWMWEPATKRIGKADECMIQDLPPQIQIHSSAFKPIRIKLRKAELRFYPN